MDFQHIVTGERISRWAYQKLSFSQQQNYRPYHAAAFSGTPDPGDNESIILGSDIPATDSSPDGGNFGGGSEGEY